MAEYYVVRDKATGQYFRGKGVNKWGKYYNQASIYRIRKNAENAVEEESRRGTQAEVVEIRIVESTADVAEVRHGRYEMGIDEGDYEYGTCSVCGYNEYNAFGCCLPHNYCPNCGADMRGEKHETL